MEENISRRSRRVFDEQFKRDAVDLVLKQGRSITAVARDLGVSVPALAKWKRAVVGSGRREVFPGHGRQSGLEEELRQVKRDLAIAQQERDILKKALSVFSQRGK